MSDAYGSIMLTMDMSMAARDVGVDAVGSHPWGCASLRIVERDDLHRVVGHGAQEPFSVEPRQRIRSVCARSARRRRA